NLNEAIAAARRVEAGDYYGQQSEIKQPQKINGELNDLKRRIDEMAINYATIAFCQSEKSKYSVENQKDTKRLDKRLKIVNYCEVNEEIFTISNEPVPQKIIKHPNKPDWGTRLRERKLPDTQQEKGDREIEIIKENSI
ncbi:5360_t:CDS:2, partial [Cetraspora pellucida]